MLPLNFSVVLLWYLDNIYIIDSIQHRLHTFRQNKSKKKIIFIFPNFDSLSNSDKQNLLMDSNFYTHYLYKVIGKELYGKLN